MTNIDTIMYLINWNRSPAEQTKGIQMAREVQCIRAFFRPCGPGYSKSVWSNCAIIICERSDDELIPHVFEMLAWLQDLNWPGAYTVLQRLLKFSEVDMLAATIETMIPALEAMTDIPWLMSIANILDNHLLRTKLRNETVFALMKYRN